MITDRAFLRAEADYLRPPTDRDVCECEQCGALDVEVNPATARHATVLSVDEGALICGDCATGADEDAERDAARDAVKALAFLAMKWQRRGTSIPTRRHHAAVDTARAECATGVATRAQGWVAL